ncbi:hypothetical protein PMIN04_003898 [Paraphaeosphaeria minitans]
MVGQLTRRTGKRRPRPQTTPTTKLGGPPVLGPLRLCRYEYSDIHSERGEQGWTSASTGEQGSTSASTEGSKAGRPLQQRGARLDIRFERGEQGSTSASTEGSKPRRPLRDSRAGHDDDAADRRDMGAPPTVIYPLILPQLVQHMLTAQPDTPSTTLIICSSRDAFLASLASAVQHPDQTNPRDSLLRLATPTLHTLSTARHVKVVFCVSVQTLLAYLTSLQPPAAPGAEEAARGERQAKAARIVLVNPLSLHAATPSFSAQGLSRTLAAAVEASLRVDAVLVVAECQGLWTQPSLLHDDGNEENGNDESSEPGEGEITVLDPWEQHVSILNVSAKKFGSGANHGAWAGRTVKVKSIAARWFRFRKLDDPEA